MRIAIYSGTYKKNQDGVARATYRLVENLLEGGHSVFIISPNISTQKKRSNIYFYQIPSHSLFFYPEYRFALLDSTLTARLDSFSPDIVHIATPDVGGFQALFYANRRRIPAVGIYHSDIFSVLAEYKFGFMRRPVEALIRYFYNRCLCVFAPTDDFVSKLEGIKIKNLDIWSRGVDQLQFNANHRSQRLRKEWNAEDKTVILYAGRVVWYKDVALLGKVYKKFIKDGNDSVKFVIVGDGPARAALQKSMPRAIFMGYQQGKQLSQAYASADLFLFPSLTETFGQVVQEALASGLPAIVSDIGGCQEIVRNADGGLIVPARNVQAFYDACQYLMLNPKIAQIYRENGLAYSIHRDWNAVNGDLIMKYQNYAYLWNEGQFKEKLQPVERLGMQFSLQMSLSRGKRIKI